MSLLMSAKWDVCVISDSSRSWVRGCYPAVCGVPQPRVSSWPLYRSWVHWPSTTELCPQPAAAQVILTSPKNCLYMYKYKTQLFIQQLATHFLKKKIKSSNFQSPIYKNVQFCYSFIFAIITYHSFHLLNPRNWTALNFHKLKYICLWWIKCGKQAWHYSFVSITDHCVFLSLYQLCSTSTASMFSEEVFVDFAANVINTLHYLIHFLYWQSDK